MKRHEKPYPNKDGELPKNMSEIEEMEFSIRQPFRQMWENGWFDDYSEEHFLIRMINGDTLYFFEVLMKTKGMNDPQFFMGNNPQTFIMNLNKNFLFLIKYFGEEPIKEFIQNQFAAGKNNYNENSFFAALSEVHILLYFLNLYNATTTKCEYEPKTGIGEHNPEVSYTYYNGLKLNIEVKTPSFTTNNCEYNSVMPLLCLTQNGREKFKDICEKNSLKFMPPRVMKLKDFINSACDKFHVPNGNEHNILFINWTDTDITLLGLVEPATLLNNPHNGILINKDTAKKLGINEKIYECITAIFLYQTSADNLLFSDFRYIFASRNAVLLLNKFILDSDEKLEKFYSDIRMSENDFKFKYRGYFAYNFYGSDNLSAQTEKLLVDVMENNLL